MKINQMIREKRKALSLTQEQVAEYLGVSAPAVNKWEKGATYPDITLLPALARLLKTDLNTLLCFHDDLTDAEIEKFFEEVDQTAREQNYETAFQMAIEKIHEYPACEQLIYSAVCYLEGALFLYNVPDPERYRTVFEPLYRRLAASERPEIRDIAVSMLISYARNKGEFSKAEELINALPFSSVDKAEQLAVLYQQQKKYEEAEKLWEHRVLKGVAGIQTALMHMLELSLMDERDGDAEFFAEMYQSITRQFCLPEWMFYNAHLQLAVAKKNKNESLAVLKKMLPAMKKKWNPQGCPLYRNVGSNNPTNLSIRLADALCDELVTKEEYEFIRDCSELKELIEQVKMS